MDVARRWAVLLSMVVLVSGLTALTVAALATRAWWLGEFGGIMLAAALGPITRP